MKPGRGAAGAGAGRGAARRDVTRHRVSCQSDEPLLAPADQLTLSLTAVRDSTVSSRLGQGTEDWGTMSLSSLPSPAASGSARIRVRASAPPPAPAEGVEGAEPGGREVLFEPLSPRLSGSPLPSALRPSAAGSGPGLRLPRPERGVLRS